MKHLYGRILALVLTIALMILPVCPAIAETESVEGIFGDTPIETLEDGDEGEDSGLEAVGGSWKRKVVALNWYKGGSKVLKVGSYGYLYDIKSGMAIKIKRCGGIAHADVEPATKSDTAKLKKMSGGSYNWNRRPGILYARGKFVAVSFNTQPHGKQTIRSNGFNGQFCLHMVYSRTHGSDKVDMDHMKTIKKAYNWAH